MRVRDRGHDPHPPHVTPHSSPDLQVSPWPPQRLQAPVCPGPPCPSPHPGLAQRACGFRAPLRGRMVAFARAPGKPGGRFPLGAHSQMGKEAGGHPPASWEDLGCAVPTLEIVLGPLLVPARRAFQAPPCVLQAALGRDLLPASQRALGSRGRS